jgi:Glycosyl transferase family 2
MRISCGMMAHNEDWVIGLTARSALTWCDDLIVVDHRSEDDTADVLCRIDEVTVIHEPGEFHPLNFYRKMAQLAAHRGSTHMVILDADEMITGSLVPLIRDAIAAVTPDRTFEVPWIPICGDLEHYDSTGPRSIDKTAFAFTDPGKAMWPVRHPGEYDIHSTRLPMHVTKLFDFLTPSELRFGGLMHLQYVDERRQRAKEVRWKMMETLRWPGRISAANLNAYYDSALQRGTLTSTPDAWWREYEDWKQYVRIGGESWEEREVKRLWQEYPGRFGGIDLLGVL